MSGTADNDPVAAADRYAKAARLAVEARKQLIASATANRKDVNLSGLARRAGIYEGTLRKWVEREVRSNGGEQPASIGA